MEIVGALLLSVLAFILLGFLMIFIVIKMVQKSFERVADKAIGSVAGMGMGIAAKAADRVLNVGEKELVKGIEGAKKAAMESDPRRMATEVTRLAKAHKGELTVSTVMAGMTVTEDLARKTLESLERRKLCVSRDNGGQKFYMFPAFKDRRQVKVCDFCESTYEMSSAKNACPSCGAELRITTAFV
jgi:rubrerythrin